MDGQTSQKLLAAGYRVDGDAVVIQLGPAVEVQANGLAHLLQACDEQKTDPMTVLKALLENVKGQPTVTAAMASPAGTKCNINY